MGLILILPILVSGFLYCTKHPELYLRLHRYEGQFLYFKIAFYGLVFLFWSIVIHISIVYLLDFLCDLFHFSFGKNYLLLLKDIFVTLNLFSANGSDIDAYQLSWIFILSSTMFAMGYFCDKAFYWNKSIRSKINKSENPEKTENSETIEANAENIKEDIKLSILEKLFSDSPLDSILFESLRQGKQLMLSMSDRKVYVGRVSSMGEPNENDGADQEIGLIPTLSGYRDKDNLDVEFTTTYKTQILDNQQNFVIVLKQENIVSATYFDEKVFEEFKKIRDNKKKDKDSSIIATIKNIEKILEKIPTN